MAFSGANLFGQQEQIVDDVLGLSLECGAQDWILGIAMPTGQVFKWHFLIMVQPKTINGAVLNPNSSAPNSAATMTSQAVRICPSAYLSNIQMK